MTTAKKANFSVTQIESRNSLVEDQAAEVVAADEDPVGVGAERVPLVEREEEHVDERQDAEDAEDGERRREQQPARPCSIACRSLPGSDASPAGTGSRRAGAPAARQVGTLLAVAEVGQLFLGLGGHLVEAGVGLDRAGQDRL